VDSEEILYGMEDQMFEEWRERIMFSEEKSVKGLEKGKWDEHNGIIIEALADYRRWFAGDLGCSDESDSIKIRQIDAAIEYVRGL